ncbi:MAG TPA: DUF2169 domain-containing protein [Chthoniobacterales bacterium]
MAAATEAPEVKAIVQGKDDTGQPVFSVLVKRTYDFGPGGRLVRCEKPRPFLQTDEYYDGGDPEWATVKYESEFAPCKPATDVVVIGRAFSPGGQPVPQLDVTVEVGAHRKTIRVTGDRHCRYRGSAPPIFSDPVPFTEMVLQYERAYGGRDNLSNPGEPFYYPRNTSGAGAVLKNERKIVEGLPLPNIEDPEDLLTPERIIIERPDRWSEQPLPDGLGWFQRTWYPRCSFTGAVPAYVNIDTVLREETLGLVPKGQIALARQFKLPGFDVRFHNGASRGLVLPYLGGDEAFRLVNLAAAGPLEFQLPGEVPGIMLDIGLGENRLKTLLHTVCVRMEEMQVDLVWRGAHAYPGWDWLPEMKKLAAEVS